MLEPPSSSFAVSKPTSSNPPARPRLISSPHKNRFGETPNEIRTDGSHVHLARPRPEDGPPRHQGHGEAGRSARLRLDHGVGPPPERARAVRRFVDGPPDGAELRGRRDRDHSARNPHPGGAAAPPGAARQGARDPGPHVRGALHLRSRAGLERARVHRDGDLDEGARPAYRRGARRREAAAHRGERLVRGPVLAVRGRHHRAPAREVLHGVGWPAAPVSRTPSRPTSRTW